MTGEGADRVARLDQACSSFSDAARMHAAYFKRLVAEGLERAEAVEITIAYIETLQAGPEEAE